MSAEPPDSGDIDGATRAHGGTDHSAGEHGITTHAPPGTGRMVLLTLPADDDGPHTVDLRHRLQAWLAGQDVSQACQEDVVLATYEAIANAVEHGYRPTVPTGSVTVTVTVHDTHIDTVVADHGRWRTPPVDPGYRGRGFALIDALAERWSINHDTTGTTVTIRFACA
jgi:anti-sigma regulatory factor (Ser/Thr protein kinase)